jgi:hypothetical protein
MMFIDRLFHDTTFTNAKGRFRWCYHGLCQSTTISTSDGLNTTQRIAKRYTSIV